MYVYGLKIIKVIFVRLKWVILKYMKYKIKCVQLCKQNE